MVQPLPALLDSLEYPTYPIRVEALEMALQHGRPEIFNTDQGSQFTSEAFSKVLLDNDISISMDGRGRCFDNIFIERLWRTVKYEHVYLFLHESGEELYKGLHDYFHFYNTQRPHQALGYREPTVYFGVALCTPKKLDAHKLVRDLRCEDEMMTTTTLEKPNGSRLSYYHAVACEGKTPSPGPALKHESGQALGRAVKRVKVSTFFEILAGPRRIPAK